MMVSRSTPTSFKLQTQRQCTCGGCGSWRAKSPNPTPSCSCMVYWTAQPPGFCTSTSKARSR
jgi:hypothetical protein